METQVLPASDPTTLLLAQRLIQKGNPVAFPTDTVYGVGALAIDTAAIRALYQIKQRDAAKAIPILISDLAEVELVAQQMSVQARRLARRFWPGALTLVVSKKGNLPEALTTLPSVGIRIPGHPVTLALLRLTGPLAVTSANISGQASPSTPDEVIAQLGGRIPLVIDGGKTPGGQPSTVVDCTQEWPVILRSGPISQDTILAAIK